MKERTSKTKVMLLQNRINILQKQLDKLETENEKLKKENEKLKNIPRKEFENLIEDIRILRNSYYQKINNLNQSISSYESDMDDLLSSIKSGVKGIIK